MSRFKPFQLSRLPSPLVYASEQVWSPTCSKGAYIVFRTRWVFRGHGITYWSLRSMQWVKERVEWTK